MDEASTKLTFIIIHSTVKTLVHTLVKMKGASITNHLTQIPDVNESDLFPYLLKVLKVRATADRLPSHI